MPNTQAFIHTLGDVDYWETWVFVGGAAKGLARSRWPSGDLVFQELIKAEHTKLINRFINDGYPVNV